MTFGSALALIVVGAILAYAVEFDVSGLDINTIGQILMIAGVVGLVLAFVHEFAYRRPRAVAPPADPYYDRTDPRYRQRY